MYFFATVKILREIKVFSLSDTFSREVQFANACYSITRTVSGIVSFFSEVHPAKRHRVYKITYKAIVPAMTADRKNCRVPDCLQPSEEMRRQRYYPARLQIQ